MTADILAGSIFRGSHMKWGHFGKPWLRRSKSSVIGPKSPDFETCVTIARIPAPSPSSARFWTAAVFCRFLTQTSGAVPAGDLLH